MLTGLLFLLFFLDSGVVIVDNVWFYGDDHKMRVLNTGDVVEIIELQDDFIKVRYDSVVSEIHRGVLIKLNDKIAEDKLLVFACGYFEEGEYEKSLALFSIFIKNFIKSNYLAEALYYYGLSCEEIAKRANELDTLQFLADQSTSPGGGLPPPFILLNKNNNQWYYRGDAYQTIIEQFPRRNYAPKASYRLVKIFRMKNLPWNDSINPIQEELAMWQDFVKSYPKSEEYVIALSEVGYLNRVLFEITNDEQYKKEATKIFEIILKKSPNSIHSANAKVNLDEIEKGENIYKY